MQNSNLILPAATAVVTLSKPHVVSPCRLNTSQLKILFKLQTLGLKLNQPLMATTEKCVFAYLCLLHPHHSYYATLQSQCVHSVSYNSIPRLFNYPTWLEGSQRCCQRHANRMLIRLHSNSGDSIRHHLRLPSSCSAKRNPHPK